MQKKESEESGHIIAVIELAEGANKCLKERLAAPRAPLQPDVMHIHPNPPLPTADRDGACPIMPLISQDTQFSHPAVIPPFLRSLTVCLMHLSNQSSFMQSAHTFSRCGFPSRPW